MTFVRLPLANWFKERQYVMMSYMTQVRGKIMYQSIPYVPADLETLYIDVRSESEYAKGHIIGAINMPILYDIERHEVGWIYKNSSVEEAKRVGLKYGSEKLHIFYDTLFKLRNEHPEKKIIFYCARGGYRSRSIASLFQSIDLPVYWLQGGYKTYRNEVLKTINQVPESFPTFIVLNGLTGVGKTHILTALKKLNLPVLDLEGAANHKGSNLGAIGTDGIQSVQSFENNLYEQLIHINAPFCFVESESRKIGQVFIPKNLFSKIQSGTYLLITADMAFRVESLIKDYAGASNFKSGMAQGLPRIKPYLTSEVYLQLEKTFESDDLDTFTELLLKWHYDPLYKKSIDAQSFSHVFHVTDYDQCALDLSNWLNHSFVLQSTEQVL
jgi:tRNA 2-selenouridine synthase